MRALMLAVMVMAIPFEQGQTKPDVGPGRVAWFDITTTDMAKSKAFYGALFGWTFKPVPGTDLAVEIAVGGTGIGTLRRAEGAISQFNGVVYIQVPDAQASCDRAKALGGTVIPGFPFDLDDGRGAVGLANDPAGHPIGFYAQTPLAPRKPAAQ